MKVDRWILAMLLGYPRKALLRPHAFSHLLLPSLAYLFYIFKGRERA